MDLSTFLQKTAPVEVEYDGETVRVDYYPRSYTAETHAIARRIQEYAADPARQDEAMELANQMLCRLLAGWDFTEGGKKLPLTVENLARFPLLFKQAVTQAVMEAMVPTPKPSATSEPGSGPAETEEAAPIGISSFERRAS